MTHPAPLWQHRAFSRLWAAQAISSFGARITREGLPILAITSLAIPGALFGGWLGTVLGVRETLLIAAAGFLVIPMIGMLSPLRAVRVNQ